VPAGCTCNSGFAGGIIPASVEPLFYGRCLPGTQTISNLGWASETNGPWTRVSDYAASSALIVVTDGTRSWASSDGAAWTGGNLIISTITSSVDYSLVFGNGIFLAISTGVPRLASSNNGVSWTAITPTGATLTESNMKLSFANGFFLLSSFSAPVYFYSTNGVAWTAGSVTGAPPNDVRISDFVFGNGQYLAVSGSYTAGFFNSPTVATMNYTNTFSGAGPWTAGQFPGGIAFGNGRFVAGNGGSTAVYVSTTGALGPAWTIGSVPFTAARYFYVQDRFFVFGWHDTSAAAVSSDGRIWFPQLLPANVVPSSGFVRRVVYHGASNKFWIFSPTSSTAASMLPG
jgi:hypothetical protein